MNKTNRLEPSQLYQRCDPEQFPFANTSELDDVAEIVGQQRARDAIAFGLGIHREGYNLFVLGPPGAGKQTLVRQMLAKDAPALPAPPDWCYVHNFDSPHQPRALRLPAGRGARLRDDMRHLVDELLAVVPQAFDSDEYRTHREQVDAEFNQRQEKAFAALAEAAGAEEIALLRTPTGFTLAPLKNGEVIAPDAFAALPEDERNRIAAAIEALQGRLEQLMRDVPRWRKEQRDRIRELNREVARYAVGSLVEELKQRYADLSRVVEYLTAVEKDLVENIDDFRRGKEPQPAVLGMPETPQPTFRRYEVNLLLDRREPAAPVVFEDNPTYQNLVGRVEHMPQFGALVTDFTLIKGGALHRANGGYLLLDAHKLLVQPFAWEGLKRALRTRRIRIESLGQMYSLVSTISLEPEAIPLDVKIVLFGDRFWYYLLDAYDPEFGELFKVAVDFDDEVPRSAENQQLFARLIATVARELALSPFGRAAVARLVEERAREVEDSERLSTHMQELVDLMTEADFISRREGTAEVGAEHVAAAIEARRQRAGRLRELAQETILRGTVLIDTAGERVGQVNGLSIFPLRGEQTFARPTRITAHTRVGDGEVIDVQREVELGGPIHSKGVLILASYLAARFCGKRPYSLRATLVFEQTYGEVEGDSASAAELCALLSSLADAPIRQSMAISGSVNQHGELQAIGAVNRKIEGFFDICRSRGLTGEHAVLIPASNVKNLMLRADVVAAVAGGKFHVHAARTVDEAIELMTGVPAGERSLLGDYPADSINGRVAVRLAEFSAIRRAFAGGPAGARKWPGAGRKARRSP